MNPSIEDFLYPVTAEEALKRWDSGSSIFTVEMGGLGPGYEQCIQILMFEIIRDHAAIDVPDEVDSEWAEKTVSRLCEPLGLTGAQVGAAKSLAYSALKQGWRHTIQSVHESRRIQVSKHFPSLEAHA